MRRGWVGALIGALLFAGPALAHDKRTDPCGCHHQYGLRHCHQKKKTERCEAPVRGQTKQPGAGAGAPSGTGAGNRSRHTQPGT
ncbi:MAG: hypothetical protein ACOZIN_14240 [Myxococcota bacterium]